jgi:recombination protein RecR
VLQHQQPSPSAPICADPSRDDDRLCVVEEPLDVLAIERTGAFRGRYHVLHGAISPMDGIGPDRLRVRELLDRAARGAPRAAYARGRAGHQPDARGRGDGDVPRRAAWPTCGSITRIARGLPVGGDLEYADEVTLVRAMQGRREFEVAER